MTFRYIPNNLSRSKLFSDIFSMFLVFSIFGLIIGLIGPWAFGLRIIIFTIIDYISLFVTIEETVGNLIIYGLLSGIIIAYTLLIISIVVFLVRRFILGYKEIVIDEKGVLIKKKVGQDIMIHWKQIESVNNRKDKHKNRAVQYLDITYVSVGRKMKTPWIGPFVDENNWLLRKFRPESIKQRKKALDEIIEVLGKHQKIKNYVNGVCVDI